MRSKLSPIRGSYSSLMWELTEMNSSRLSTQDSFSALSQVSAAPLLKILIFAKGTFSLTFSRIGNSRLSSNGSDTLNGEKRNGFSNRDISSIKRSISWSGILLPIRSSVVYGQNVQAALHRESVSNDTSLGWFR